MKSCMLWQIILIEGMRTEGLSERERRGDAFVLEYNAMTELSEMFFVPHFKQKQEEEYL